VTENAAGATVIEYAFIAGLISIAGVALFTQMGGFLVTTFTSVANGM
jgi:Flp pilus assembly pilin Flp